MCWHWHQSSPEHLGAALHGSLRPLRLRPVTRDRRVFSFRDVLHQRSCLFIQFCVCVYYILHGRAGGRGVAGCVRVAGCNCEAGWLAGRGVGRLACWVSGWLSGRGWVLQFSSVVWRSDSWDRGGRQAFPCANQLHSCRSVS